MMIYQPVNSLFIPKANGSDDLESDSLKDNNKGLNNETEILLSKIKSYEKLIKELTEEIELKDDTIFNLKDKVSILENDLLLLETKEFTAKLPETESLDIHTNCTDEKPTILQESKDLDNDTNSRVEIEAIESQSKDGDIVKDDYTQLLYILILVLWIM